MVPIFTHRDERALFTVVGTIIVAALLALLQLNAVRNGWTNPIAFGASSLTGWIQAIAVSAVNGTRDGFASIGNLPNLARENASLTDRVHQLEQTNATLRETLARVPAEAALARAQLANPHGVSATVIGFDPENTSRTVTIDRGAKDHVERDAGVLTGDGAVGRVVEVGPFSAKVLLINDPQSRLPVLIQRGRWWAIAVGTQHHVKLHYVAQDAPLKVGDNVVTGEGRTFHAGVPIGRISALEPKAVGALDQTAIVEPAANLAALTRVFVVSK